LIFVRGKFADGGKRYEIYSENQPIADNRKLGDVVVSTNSKICWGPNIFGVTHGKSGKDRRNFVQENEKFFWKQTIYKVYGHSFLTAG
jgi:hypothetical protein